MEEPVDQVFKDHLQHSVVAFDEAHWAQMEVLLDGRKGKRRFLYIWLLAGLSASLVVTSLFFTSESLLGSKLNALSSVESALPTDQPRPLSNQPSGTTNLTDSTLQAEPGEATAQLVSAASPALSNPVDTIPVRASATSSEAGPTPVAEGPNQPPSGQGNIEPLKPSGERMTGGDTSTVVEDYVTPLAVIDDSPAARTETTTDSTTTEAALPVLQDTSSSPEATAQPMLTEENPADTIALQPELTEEQSDSIPSEDSVIVAHADSIPESHIEPTLAVADTVADSTNQKPLHFLHFNAGFGPLSRALTGDNPAYLRARTESETLTPQSLFELGASWQFQRFGVGTALALHQVEEELNYAAEDNSYWDVEDLSTWQITDNSFYDYTDSVFIQGQWTYLDSVYVVNIDSLHQPNYDSTYVSAVLPGAKATNRLRYLTIPLNFSYRRENERWGLTFSGGPTLSILIGREGQYPNPAMDGYEDLKSSPHLRKMVLGFRGSAEVYYRFTPHLHLGLAPYLRMQLSDAYRGESIRQKYRQVGLRAGLSWRW